MRGQRQVYNANRPELHDVLRRWRTIAESYDHERLLVGETFFGDIDLLAVVLRADDDELHLAFNFPLHLRAVRRRGSRDVVDTVERLFPADAWPAWMGSNHDVYRFATRWAKGDERKVRLALMMLLTLRGTPFLYYGDEIGMPDRPFAKDEVLDPVGVRFHPVAGRDPERTPMHWTARSGGRVHGAGCDPVAPVRRSPHRATSPTSDDDDALGAAPLARPDRAAQIVRAGALRAGARRRSGRTGAARTPSR